ncbi:hydroxymethylbilane synthase [Thermotomaculum hydrothermale]|uniref:Porphobilinogen deaminase n=1 Tax=Thermotomaculum hydrothermale TaxID=981385 RepID=A0A7R6SYZ4_9BACT|nr:hydroxymethylbilane synthase [Thermotomaculum hydrothermale]BBB33314.1 hydroxymethylbilane synthase [Thermotomaculum hydrothermale]
MKVIIGTRGSKLALWQANTVKSLLEEKYPDVEFELRIIKTTGDIDQKTPLSQMGGIGLFTKQLEKALEDKEIDIAVHSFKDMPSVIDERFEIAAVLKREKVNDVFISKKYTLNDLKDKTLVIGTGSLRRVSQLKANFPQIETKNLRGNVDTRLRKLEEGQYDGIILAYAGVKRLGFEDRITDIIPTDILIPAVAQGAVAVEIRRGDEKVKEIVSSINHRETEICVEQERDFLRIVEGGCRVPVGAYARFDGDSFVIDGFVGSLNGERIVKHKIILPKDDIEDSGKNLANYILENGGREILKEVEKRC